MEPRLFSSLSRSLGSRITRRSALSSAGGCGLAMGLLGTARVRGAFAAPAERGAGQVAGVAAQGDAPAWRITGQVMEACRCAVTCPCNFSSDPTEIPCDSIIG